MFKLELKLQNLVLKEYVLSDGATLKIGRHSENDIVLKDMSVSRHHATIEARGHRLFVRDARSKNGTIVNGTKAKSAELCIMVMLSGLAKIAASKCLSLPQRQRNRP
jgi:pSer/pThr/pTyr-binding forkhead associated (FHA) protein